MKEKKSLWEIFVPSLNEEGSKISVDYHRAWDSNVREITGGLTILKTAKGQWINPDGKLFVEPMIPVRIMASKKQMETIVDFTSMHYRQEAVMFYRVSKKVKIRHFSKN